MGVPTNAYWAMGLDPRAKWKLSKILPLDSITSLWKDVKEDVLEIATQMVQNNVNNDAVHSDDRQLQEQQDQ